MLWLRRSRASRRTKRNTTAVDVRLLRSGRPFPGIGWRSGSQRLPSTWSAGPSGFGFQRRLRMRALVRLIYCEQPAVELIDVAHQAVEGEQLPHPLFSRRAETAGPALVEDEPRDRLR